MKRRTFLSAAGAALATPSIVRAEATRVLKFIPQTDVTVIDPIYSTAYVSRNHGMMVFDTLFGVDGKYQPQPQMVDGVSIENNGLLWNLTLRDGLRFHDGEPVLARDCVASIRRWAVRDTLGASLMAATEELSAPDDRTIRFRLKKPFPLLPAALGKVSTPFLAIMPERLANTDPFKQVTEIVGSGPFRYRKDERVVGSRVVYERFDGYRPREGGTPDWTAGPKRVNFDRVEWIVIPDDATAAGSIRAGEMDWWELPTNDLIPSLKKSGKVRVEVKDPTGVIGFMRMNCLQPPFDNPAIRRALFGAVQQQDFIDAIAGTQAGAGRTGVGVFCPDTSLATNVGMDILNGPRDLTRVKAEIKAAGYSGDKMALMVATDGYYRKAMGDVGAEMLRSAGLNVDYQAVDFGTMVQRRENRSPVDKGGWSALFTTLSGLDLSTPTGHAFKANGEKAWFGWPTSARIETLRAAWLEAPDLPAQQAIATDIQRQWWIDAPHLPIGQWFQPAAYQGSLDGMVNGFPLFWGIKRS
jgi:peptide/nickel transport system substrate-binding protein